MGYQGQALKGFTWIGGIRVVTRILSFSKTLIIARILSPAQFGLFGIATLVLSLIEILTETGINIFLVQHKGEEDSYINTAWIISIIRGIFICLLIILLAPFIALFFNAQEAQPLLFLISIVPLIKGFINPSIVKFQKDLEFNKEFYYRSSVFFIETMVSVILVVIVGTISSLIYAMIVSSFFEVILSFVIARPLPKFSLERKKLFHIIGYGKWITTGSVFNYFYQHGDDIVIGRLLGTSSLGLYDMIYKISLAPLVDIAEVVAKVTFPVYVKIADDKVRLKKVFIKTLAGVLLLVLPIGLILYLFPEKIISIVLGSQWVIASSALQVLALFGVVRAVSVFSSTLFLSVNKQHIHTYATFIGLFGLGVTIIPFIMWWGIVGAAFSALFGTTLTLPFIFYHIVKIFR